MERMLAAQDRQDPTKKSFAEQIVEKNKQIKEEYSKILKESIQFKPKPEQKPPKNTSMS